MQLTMSPFSFISTLLLASTLRIVENAYAFAPLMLYDHRDQVHSGFSRIVAASVNSSDDSERDLLGVVVPTLEQLASDSFPKQVQHAGTVIDLLMLNQQEKTDDTDFKQRLSAMLSHPDGVRGFMVTYLTMHKEKEDSEVPSILLQAILDVTDPENDKNELISLLCSNVIMPTAMVTIHKDPKLIRQSALTAARAMNLMTEVMEASGDRDSKVRQAVTKQCNAILKMATSKDIDAGEGVDGKNTDQLYWQKVFESWGYKDAQLTDIANAARMVLSK